MSGGSSRALRSGEAASPWNRPAGTRGIPAWCAAEASRFSNHTPSILRPERYSSEGSFSPTMPPQLEKAGTFSCAMPIVKPAMRACVTSWQVEKVLPFGGRRSPGTAAMASTLSNSFMPIGKVRSRSSCVSCSANCASALASGAAAAGPASTGAFMAIPPEDPAAILAPLRRTGRRRQSRHNERTETPEPWAS